MICPHLHKLTLRNMVVFMGILVLVVCHHPAVSWAKDARDKLVKVEEEMRQQKEHEHELADQARATDQNLKELRQQLITATDLIESKSLEEEQLEDRLDEIEKEIALKQLAYHDRQTKMKLFCSLLIEMARQPLETFFLQKGLTHDYIRRGIVMRTLIPKMKIEAIELFRELEELKRMRKESEEQKNLVLASRANLEHQQVDLDQLIKSRQGLLQRTESEKQVIQKQLVALTTEAKDLRQLLERISPRRSLTKPPSVPDGISMKWPVSGAISRKFGDRDKDGVLSEGITFLALPGSPVVTPLSGKVVFAGPFRGYGQIVILQHENGFHSFLAGLGRIDVDMGQEMETGEPLGSLPASSRRRVELYFEWRHDNEPIDPIKGNVLSKKPR